MKHLQTLAPDMFSMVEQADEPHRRIVCLAVCDYAVSKNRPLAPIAEDALTLLRSSKSYDDAMVRELDALIELFDNQYFELKDKSDEMEESPSRSEVMERYKENFRKARAVAALRFAGDDDSFEAATEAIYEASASVGERQAVFELVKRILS